MYKNFQSGLVATVLALLFTIVAAPARAQNSFGIIAGFNLGNISFDPSINSVYETLGYDNATTSGVNGVAAGAFFERPVGGFLNLRVEALFSQTGTTYQAGLPAFDYTFEDEIKLSMVEVPVMVVFPLGVAEKLRVMGGILMAFHVSQKETLRGTDGGEDFEEEFEGDDQAGLKSPHLGIALGGEFALTPMIGVGGRLNLGLTDINDADTVNDGLFATKMRMRVMRIYVVFNLK